MEAAVSLIGKTSGTEEENQQILVNYLIEEYPTSNLDFSSKHNDWLITEVYMTEIIKDLEVTLKPNQVQQTPFEYFESLLFKLQGVTTAGMSRLQVLQYYCR